MSAQKKNIAKKREREKPKKDKKRQNVKTRKRALREEKASPFSVEKERATFYPFDFFSSRGDTRYYSRALYTLARGIEPLFAAQEEKAERIFARCLT